MGGGERRERELWMIQGHRSNEINTRGKMQDWGGFGKEGEDGRCWLRRFITIILQSKPILSPKANDPKSIEVKAMLCVASIALHRPCPILHSNWNEFSWQRCSRARPRNGQYNWCIWAHRSSNRHWWEEDDELSCWEEEESRKDLLWRQNDQVEVWIWCVKVLIDGGDDEWVSEVQLNT